MGNRWGHGYFSMIRPKMSTIVLDIWTENPKYTVGGFNNFEKFLDIACSLPVFDVLKINFNEQKIFKIYFIKKDGSLHFPK